jgi:transcriptional regulator with XRE-family HTH domain
MGKLTDLIDDYRQRQGGVSEASVARAIGISPGTISAWRNRGLVDIPDAQILRDLAAFIKVDESVTFYAAGVDANYIIEVPADPDADTA